MNLSETEYSHVKKLFIPKHLDLGALSKKKKMLRDRFSIKSVILDVESHNKKELLRPLKEL